MELSSFIITHHETILGEWEKDARRRIPGDQNLDIAVLRDHLGELLNTIAHDLAARQRAEERPSDAADSGPRGHVDTVAEKHGAQRARQGMTLRQVTSEFPILRACTARLWVRAHPTTTPTDLESLIAFDEAIDRALTKSASEFMDQIDQSRDTFLGVLGHDLRDPLATVIAGGQLLLEPNIDDAGRRDVAQRIVSTGERMHHLVVDLLDATRARSGGEMPITRREADLGAAVRQIADEFTTSHPDRTLNVTIAGDPRGQWDDRRVGQAVANLVSNALRFAHSETPIDIAIRADDEVAIAVHNEGPPIPEERRITLFEPLSGNTNGGDGRDPEHFGLGLYIAKAIVAGHGGHIDVDSAADRGTTFTIHLPRASSAD